MANIDYIERDYFEVLFDMNTGYVLDFTNRTFQEFVYEKINIDVYTKYQGISKAKILRRIMCDCDDVSVGKLLLELMRYMQAKEMVSNEKKEIFKKCADIGNRLIGKKITARSSTSVTSSKPASSFVVDYDSLLNELANISSSSDTPQARGFQFEKYLSKVFDVYRLEPRGSFKLKGEQIDGSFVLHNEVYLLEAKWTNQKIDKSELVIFNEKVCSKSGFTRGLFISFSGFSDEALTTFASGRTVNIVLMTVQELAVVLSRKLDLKKVLSDKVRVLAEEGNFYKSIFSL